MGLSLGGGATFAVRGGVGGADFDVSVRSLTERVSSTVRFGGGEEYMEVDLASVSDAGGKRWSADGSSSVWAGRCPFSGACAHLIFGGEVRISSLSRQLRADDQKESVADQRMNPLTPVANIASFCNFLEAHRMASALRRSIAIQTALGRSLRR